MSSIVFRPFKSLSKKAPSINELSHIKSALLVIFYKSNIPLNKPTLKGMFRYPLTVLIGNKIFI